MGASHTRCLSEKPRIVRLQAATGAVTFNTAIVVAMLAILLNLIGRSCYAYQEWGRKEFPGDSRTSSQFDTYCQENRYFDQLLQGPRPVEVDYVGGSHARFYLAHEGNIFPYEIPYFGTFYYATANGSLRYLVHYNEFVSCLERGCSRNRGKDWILPDSNNVLFSGWVLNSIRDPRDPIKSFAFLMRDQDYCFRIFRTAYLPFLANYGQWLIDQLYRRYEWPDRRTELCPERWERYRLARMRMNLGGFDNSWLDRYLPPNQ